MGLSAFLIIFVLVFLLTSSRGLLQKKASLRTYMDDASGIMVSTPVRLSTLAPLSTRAGLSTRERRRTSSPRVTRTPLSTRWRPAGPIPPIYDE